MRFREAATQLRSGGVRVQTEVPASYQSQDFQMLSFCLVLSDRERKVAKEIKRDGCSPDGPRESSAPRIRLE